MENLYLLSGDDEYEKNKMIEDFKKSFQPLKKGINFVQVDKENLYQLEQELTTYSFFNEPKLIIVKLAKKAGDEEEGKSKKEDKPQNRRSERIVLSLLLSSRVLSKEAGKVLQGITYSQG